MTRYLLDTNTISEIVKHPSGPIARRSELERDNICTSVIVAAELEFWMVKRPSVARRAALDMIFRAIEVIAFDRPADETYAAIRSQLESTGMTIGGNDMLIAAQAVALGLTVVTDNEGEFRRVPGLAVENWLRD